MKKNKIAWGRLFYNNKFAIFFSVLMSVVLWAFMISTDTQNHARAIFNVPINITLSNSAQQDGLKVFSQTDAKATVYVKGNSFAVNQIKSGDLEVTAPLASTITTPNSYTLMLSAHSKDSLNNNDFTVDSITPQQVLVTVDRYKEKTFNIQSQITYREGYKSDAAYFVGSPVLSSDTVTISGPEKQVLQVNRAAFHYEIGNTLTDTQKFTATLDLYDANENKIEKGDLTISPEKVDVSIPVLPRQVIPLDASFTNRPAGLGLPASQVQIAPGSIEVAGPRDVLANLAKISLDPIDFSKISPTDNSFDVDINLPSTCKNLSNIPTAKVTVDLNGMTARKMNVTSFNIKNLGSDKSASVYTKSLAVTVVGPADEVAKLTDGNVTAQVDMSGKENFTGQTEMPATFSISNAASSWVYGTYMVNMSVSQKSP